MTAFPFLDPDQRSALAAHGIDPDRSLRGLLGRLLSLDEEHPRVRELASINARPARVGRYGRRRVAA